MVHQKTALISSYMFLEFNPFMQSSKGFADLLDIENLTLVVISYAIHETSLFHELHMK